MKKLTLLFIILILPFALTGCSLSDIFLSSGSGSQAGVFKSYDYGETWNNSSLIEYKGKRAVTINNLQINKISIDPLNHKNIFLGTTTNGLWHSNNAGDNWQQISKSGYIYDIALDAQNSGVVYISNGKNVLVFLRSK